VYTTKEGDEHHGDFETEFSARSFGPGCNPMQPPRLTLTPQEPAAEPAAASSSTEAKQKKTAPRDSREQDKGEDAPVAPPDQGGYAK
jgi:hypothetical protein